MIARHREGGPGNAEDQCQQSAQGRDRRPDLDDRSERVEAPGLDGCP